MLTMKRGDTPTVRWRVLDADGSPVDLTNAVGELHLQRGSATPVNANVVILAPETEGRVEHTFDGTMGVGTWQYEIEFTRAGVVMTAPTNGTYRLVVESDIA